MWLRQEHRKGSFEVVYLETISMLADGLTKHLLRQKFQHFKELLNLKQLDYIAVQLQEQEKL